MVFLIYIFSFTTRLIVFNVESIVAAMLQLFDAKI